MITRQGSTTASPTTDPRARGETFKFALKCGFALAWGIVIAPAGLALVASVIGSPLGVPILMLAAYPLYRTVKKRTDRLSAWEAGGHVMDNDEETPWLMN